MINYINSIDNIEKEKLHGFFVGWPNPPSQEKHLEILKNSTYIWLAVKEEGKEVVGFINAISDKTLSSYIPLLEVLPEYQGRGIGRELVKRMLHTLKDYYMIDLLCDDELTPFYKSLGMFKSSGMLVRNYSQQEGRG
ncbi:GNAT family N-acetyltransferase [Alkaliphilus transvaalensis]|uniref:GNAT family N-acetyltransferase n=1 Tax=Alkaliphilus transvaalensis TaxID=114628 RepID=UPI000AC3CE8B|nr:GNAT family N-acetyltransferase [Alkaliphilus transvaalensis]